jgi:LPXTG-site transpeptidase (sortase) family protein
VLDSGSIPDGGTKIRYTFNVKSIFTVRKISTFLIFLGLGLAVYGFAPFILEEGWYRLMQYRNRKYVIGTTESSESTQSVFGKLISDGNVDIEPANRDFSLVVEKIGLNAPVILGVSVTNAREYNEALKHGIAHAVTSDLPSTDPSNVYLFAHTSFNFWGINKYATTFNLLRKLEPGDEVNVFYHNKRYVYEVINKEIMSGWNTYPLTRPVLEPILTMQTCDPPGTTFNRLVVTSKLKRVI